MRIPARLSVPLFICAFLLGLPAAAAASILINVNTSAQRMTVTVDGVTRWVWPVSTGNRGHATPSGAFTAFRMEEEHFSKEFDDAPMPHSIFFTKQGHAIHGTLDARHLGSAVSHGCVRLSTAHAAKLYVLVEQQGLGATQVVIRGGNPGRAPAVARQPVPQEEDEADDSVEAAPRYGVPDAIYVPSSTDPPLLRGFSAFGRQ